MRLISKNIDFYISDNVVHRMINRNYIGNKFKEALLEFKNKHLNEYNEMISAYKNKGLLYAHDENSETDLIEELINILSIRDVIASYKGKPQSGTGIINNTVLGQYSQIKPITFFLSDLSIKNEIYSISHNYVKVIFQILKQELSNNMEYFNSMLKKNYIDNIFKINEDEFDDEFLFFNDDEHNMPQKIFTPKDIFNDEKLIEKMKHIINEENLISWDEIEDYCEIELEENEYFDFMKENATNIDEKIDDMYFDNNFNAYTVIKIL